MAFQNTTHTFTGPDADTDRWVRVHDGPSTSAWKHVRTLTGAPPVTGETVSSSAGADATYAIGEVISLAAAFDEHVTVTTAGTPVAGPRIAFTLGDETKHAVYASGNAHCRP